ncbi:MAG: LytTR family DNA-binding domain-containing protein [Saprospiraceae bacterium]
MKRQSMILQEKGKIIPLKNDAVPFSQLSKFRLNKLMIYEKSSILFINYDDIIYCQANSNYTIIFKTDNTKIITARCLKDISQSINSNAFFRVHASYLVNIKYVTGLTKDTNWMMNLNDVTIPIARSRFDSFKSYLNIN